MSSHNKTKSESFFTRCNRLELELSKVDEKTTRLVAKHSEEIHTKESQIKILESQLKSTKERLDEMTLLYNNSESKNQKLIKKIDNLGMFARS